MNPGKNSIFYQPDAQIIYFLIYLLHSSTCFEHYLQEVKIVSVQHLVSSLSLGDCSVHRLREEPSLNLWYRHSLQVTVQYTG
jgi:hypothetical protein